MSKKTEKLDILLKASKFKREGDMNYAETKNLIRESEVLMLFALAVTSFEEAEKVEKRLYKIKDRLIQLKEKLAFVNSEMESLAHGLELGDILKNICKN